MSNLRPRKQKEISSNSSKKISSGKEKEISSNQPKKTSSISSSSSKETSSVTTKETNSVRKNDQDSQFRIPDHDVYVDIPPLDELFISSLLSKGSDDVVASDTGVDLSGNATTEIKRKSSNYNIRNNAVKVPRLNSKDVDLLNKTLYYSKKAYEEALYAKESSLRTEAAINDFIKEQLSHINNVSEDSESKGTSKRKIFWYTQTIVNTCSDLFFVDKNPNDEDLREFIYRSLADAHPEEMEKIERTGNGWKKYWDDVLRSAARSEVRVKRANYVRNIKNAISNIFGKTCIGEVPGNKISTEKILEWKNSMKVKQAKDKLWTKVDGNGEDDNDTYMNRIMNEIFKPNQQTPDNCAFVIAVVEMIFDAEVQTTTLTGEMISSRVKEKLKDLNENNEDDNNPINDDVDDVSSSDGTNSN